MDQALQSQISILASCNGKLEALVAVYHKSISPDVLHAIHLQRYSIHALLKRRTHDVTYFFLPTDEQVFKNTNT